MLDLVLCVLATTKNNRIGQFSKIGYKKTNKYNSKIVYLINNEEKPIEIVIPESKAKLCHDALPYTMYDAFGNRERRINFSE